LHSELQLACRVVSPELIVVNDIPQKWRVAVTARLPFAARRARRCRAPGLDFASRPSDRLEETEMATKNEGEGSRTAARRYNEGAHKTAKKRDMPDAAPRSDEEQREMEAAEREGSSRAKERDPAVPRDYTKPTK
jgi:hypothetical protein